MLTRRTALTGLAGCAFGVRPVGAQALPKIPVVATFSVLADLVRAVGGDRIDVATLVPPGGDVHGFVATSAETRTLTAARLIVENGLGLESWIDRLIGSAAAQAPVLVVSRGIKPISRDERAATPDPHAWMAPPNAKLYVAAIRDALRRLDVAGSKLFTANAAAYGAKLDALDAEIRAGIESIPPVRRVICCAHDGYAYFAATYGLRALTPAALGTGTPAGAREIAIAVKQVKAAGAPAVFADAGADPAAARQIATDSGIPLAGTLYADTLSPAGGPAASYLDLIRSDLRTIVGGLRTT